MARNSLQLKIAICLFSAVLVFGCAKGPQLTREEQLQMLKSHALSGEKVYEGTTVNKVADAAVKVLTLMDPPDARFVHFDNRMIMYRYYTAFMVFNAVHGFDVWALYFEELPNSAVKVTVRVTGVQNFGMFATVPALPHVPSTPAEYTNLSEAENKLFLSRLDYMMGLSTDWIPCSKAKEFAKANGYRVHNDFGPFPRVCGDNWFGIEDRRPEEWDKIRGN